MLATPSHQRHGTRGEFAKSPGPFCVKGLRAPHASISGVMRHRAMLMGVMLRIPRMLVARIEAYSLSNADSAKTVATFGSGVTSMPRQSKGLTVSLRLACAVTRENFSLRSVRHTPTLDKSRHLAPLTAFVPIKPMQPSRQSLSCSVGFPDRTPSLINSAKTLVQHHEGFNRPSPCHPGPVPRAVGDTAGRHYGIAAARGVSSPAAKLRQSP